VAFLRWPKPSFGLDDAAATASRGYALGVEVPHNPRDRQPPGYDELGRRG
jgi:hypothetical protein